MRPTPKAGIERNSITLAMSIDQVKRGIFIHPMPSARITAMVVRKLIPVSVEEATSMSCPAAHIVVPACAVSLTT